MNRSNKKNIVYDWSDILDYPKQSEANLIPLEEVRQNLGAATGGTLEITMNYPRVPSFVNKQSGKQKELYSLIWNGIKNTCGMDISSSGYVFEYCQSGHIHLHGWISYDDSKKLFPVGLVADYVKAFLQALPKKYKLYKDACMHKQYCRYRSPCICVQYTDKEDRKRHVVWQDYINKCVQK